MKKEFIEYSLQSKDIYRKSDPHPVVLKFQNEFAASEVESCGLYKERGAPEQVAAVRRAGMLYTGHEVNSPLCQNYLLVKNKSSGKVRLIEVGTACLKAVISKDLSKTIEVDKNELREKFGSKRQKRHAEQYKKMKIDVETVKEQLESAAMRMEIDPRDIANQTTEAESSVTTYTPPADREATDPRNVYKLSDILNEEQLETLKSTAVTLLEEETYEIHISDYVTNLIGKLRSTNVDNKITNCSVLLYVDCILRYLTVNYKTACSPKYVICSYSDMINSMVFNNFSSVTDKGRTRPQTSKDKAICHILVLLLIISDCTITDVETLRLALNISLKKLANYVKIIGARITSGAITSIVLKIPLVGLPSLKVREKKK